MRLTEITKDEFVGMLKDPFMGRVVAGVNLLENMLANNWKIVTRPTYDHNINDPLVKTKADDLDVIIFKIQSIWPKGTSSRDIESDCWQAGDIIEKVFSSGSDDDQDWGKNGEEIRTLTVYVFENDDIYPG